MHACMQRALRVRSPTPPHTQLMPCRMRAHVLGSLPYAIHPSS